MVQAPENLKQLNLTRMEELESDSKANCATDCNKSWFECDLELLCLNSIDLAVLYSVQQSQASSC